MNLKRLVTVLAMLTAASAFGQSIERVVFRQQGAYPLSEDIFEMNTQTKAGMPYSERIVNEDVRRLFSLGMFEEIDSKVNDLSKITKTDLGNLIVIDKHFKFEKKNMVGAEEVSISDLPSGMNMIGYNAADNVKRYHFDPDRKPVLAVEYGQSIGELESIPAIKRTIRQEKEQS